MIDIEELEDKFSIEGEVGFAELVDGFTFVTVVNKFAEADICLYGGHITNFRPNNTMEILWMSSESKFQKGLPIRGGIPVCFPWFGQHKTDADKPLHGFARIMEWDVAETKSQPTGETLIRLKLNSSEETKALWAHDFSAELIIVVGKKLSTTLKVTNTSSETYEYTGALHSYFYFSSIENIAVEGLQNTKYHDQLVNENLEQAEPLLKIQKAETRHYYNTESPCIIHDSAFGRRIFAGKTGSKVTTVWNPGEEACRNIGDLHDDDYQTFLCVEAVNAFDDVITLKPGESHETSAIIGLAE